MIGRITVPTPGVKVIQPMGGVAGWWDPNNDGLCIWGAWRAKGAASLAASYVDESGNGNNVAPGIAPNWNAAQGWICDGTRWLDTGFIPDNDQSQSMIAQFDGLAGTLKAVCGYYEAVGTDRRFHLIPQLNVAQSEYANGGRMNIGSAGFTSGNMAVTDRPYKNGVLAAALVSPAWGAPALDTVYLCALNQLGVGANFEITGDLWAVAIYDCILTGPQVLAVATAMALL